jgi:hypothetical protein
LVHLASDDAIFHGAVLRCKGNWPYEEIVDFLVVNNHDQDRGMSLVVSSGHKAGLPLVVLPKESETGHDNYADYINVDWLKNNWTEWIYPDCDVMDVYISAGYPPAGALPQSSNAKN